MEILINREYSYVLMKIDEGHVLKKHISKLYSHAGNLIAETRYCYVVRKLWYNVAWAVFRFKVIRNSKIWITLRFSKSMKVEIDIIINVWNYAIQNIHLIIRNIERMQKKIDLDIIWDKTTLNCHNNIEIPNRSSIMIWSKQQLVLRMFVRMLWQAM